MAKSKSVSETLKTAIVDSGMTHYRLGKLSGVRPEMISRFVSEERHDIRASTIDKLAGVLGLELRATKTQTTNRKRGS